MNDPKTKRRKCALFWVELAVFAALTLFLIACTL